MNNNSLMAIEDSTLLIEMMINRLYGMSVFLRDDSSKEAEVIKENLEKIINQLKQQYDEAVVRAL